MKYLNLDKEFVPKHTNFTNEIKFESFTFKGGEPHIKLDTQSFHFSEIDTNIIVITHRINSFNDLGLLVTAVNAVRHELQRTRKYNTKLELIIPYFPAARQDRLMIKGEPLTVKVYTDIINSLKFSRVTILDPHSDVTPVLLDNVYVIDNHEFVLEALKHMYPHVNAKTPILISPDAGSNKKVTSLGMYLSKFNVMDIVKCDKTRDVKTGAITDFVVYADDLEGRDCVIVDDICDGGGTFLGLGKKLKEKNCGDLYLIVTHGIFSRGFKELNSMFKMVYTTDSIKNYDSTYLEAHRHHKGFEALVREIKIKRLLK